MELSQDINLRYVLFLKIFSHNVPSTSNTVPFNTSVSSAFFCNAGSTVANRLGLIGFCTTVDLALLKQFGS
jgi:hypothetical protein